MRIDVDGTGIEFDVTGPDEAVPVVLVHGFPDSAEVWRLQVPALVRAGFRVITPDLRGFGRSDRPEGVENYSVLHAAGDVAAVLDELGVLRAHLVGHDFGAMVSWVVATFMADRVDHLVALSVGHPASFRLSDPDQASAAWHMLLFGHQGVAEEWLSANEWANLRAWSGHPDADRVIEQLARPGALTSGLNWYRANVPPEAWVAPPAELPPVTASTMGVWSSADFALLEPQMVGSSQFVDGPWRYECIEGAGHWVQLEAPDELNRLLVEFLSS